jgi:peptidoglycan/LPS O-acetylase OafA/YrhL
MPTLDSVGDTVAYFNAAAAFWVRRAWRLLPSAWLWLAVILAGAIFFNRSQAFGTFRANFEGVVAAVLDIANFRIVEVFSRFEPGAAFPYWSLSLEEQFYILLPFLIFIFRRRLPYVLAVLVLAQFFWRRSGEDTTRVGLMLNQLRSDALSLGVLIAIWSRHPTYRLFEPIALKRRPVAGVVILSVLIICLAAVGSRSLHIVWFQIGMVALISAVIVLIASFDGDYLCPEGAVKRLMLWVGARSYGIYLIHIPVYCMTREIWFRIEPPGTVFDAAWSVRFIATAALLILAFAELNYRFVEVPFRRRGARIAERLGRRVA